MRQNARNGPVTHFCHNSSFPVCLAGEPSVTKEQRNEKILKAIEDATAKGSVSKKKARETLVSSGIYTAKGKLKVEFGGVSQKRDEAAA